MNPEFETAVERIRKFRTVRLAEIRAGETPVSLGEGGHMVFHVLPLGSFMDTREIDITVHKDSLSCLPTMMGHGQGGWINGDRFVTSGPDAETPALFYTQLFRTGEVESLARLGFLEGPNKFTWRAYERMVVKFLESYVKLATELGIDPPYCLSLSLVGVRGYELIDPMDEYRVFPEPNQPFREDTLTLPGVVIENLDIPLERILKPVFDGVWDEFGRVRPPNPDDQGN